MHHLPLIVEETETCRPIQDYSDFDLSNPEGGSDLDMDIVGETKDRIFIFECKKKVLTNASRRGETVSSLRDLNDSFLKFTMQLARHESALRTQETITFRDGKNLSLSGRKIEKFGIS
jgi:hypothetical protein